jgi:NAD(P)-dependent dehydrogenase (short-subunit alcohol dehydrogenase family)
MGLVEGKVAIVTGAGSGIGRATAQRLAAEGAAVVAADLNPDGAKETVAMIKAAGGQGLAQEADVSSEDSVKDMVQAAVDTFGALHCLHNNAADVVIIQRDLDIVGMDIEVWDRTMAVNVRGAMLGMKHAIPHMIAAGGGAIVNTSSLSGQMGDLGRVAYGVSKAGVDSLTRYGATLYGKKNIRVNAIAPGVVMTPSVAANVPDEELAVYRRNHVTPGIGQPEHMANVVVFLMSDEAAYVTGQVINVDGGMRMHSPIYSNFVQED